MTMGPSVPKEPPLGRHAHEAERMPNAPRPNSIITEKHNEFEKKLGNQQKNTRFFNILRNTAESKNTPAHFCLHSAADVLKKKKHDSKSHRRAEL